MKTAEGLLSIDNPFDAQNWEQTEDQMDPRIAKLLELALPIITIQVNNAIVYRNNIEKAVAEGNIAEVKKSLLESYNILHKNEEHVIEDAQMEGYDFSILQLVTFVKYNARPTIIECLTASVDMMIKSEAIHDESVKDEVLKLVIEVIKNHDWELLNTIADNKLLKKGMLNGHTELFAEIAEHRPDIALFLRKNSVFEFLYNQNELDTKLHLACICGDFEKVRILLAAGANPLAKNIDGNDALTIAVTYPNSAELNISSAKRSAEIKKIMSGKQKIVDLLLKNPSVVSNKQNVQNAFSIAVNQGLTVGENGIVELRGDHKIMESLLKAGANPIFGQYEWSLKFKMTTTALLAVGLTCAKNYLIALTGMSFIINYLLFPISLAINLALDSVVAYKAYLDVKNPLYVMMRTFLSSEYANDTLINLSKVPLIGNYQVNWFGLVVSGEQLREKLSNHVGFSKLSSARFSLSDLPQNEDGTIRMNLQEKLELETSLFNNYQAIRFTLENSFFLFPWTREALKEILVKIEETSKVNRFGYNLNIDFDATFKRENVVSIAKELDSNQEMLGRFYQIRDNVNNGSLRVSLESRYSIELISRLLNNEKNIVPFAELKEEPKELFAKLNSQCEEFKLDEYNFSTVLKLIEFEHNKDIKENRDVRTIWERVKDGTSFFSEKVFNGAADAAAFVFNTDRERVFHNVANGAACAGAAANGMAWGAARHYIVDTWWFLPTVTLGALAYGAYKAKEPIIAVANGVKYSFEQIACAFAITLGYIAACFEFMKNSSTSLSTQEEKDNLSEIAINEDLMKYEIPGREV